MVIDVISPASKSFRSFTAEDTALIEKHLGGLAKLQFRGHFQKHPFHSAPDLVRFRDLQDALMNPDSQVIWCRRGGYGALRLAPLLEKLTPPPKKKLLVGFSDITSLHAFFNQRWGWPSVHGPVLDSLINAEVKTQSKKKILNLVKKFLSGERRLQQLLPEPSSIKPLNAAAKKNKKSLQGLLSGGNLCTLASHCGTSLQIIGKGRILFFEDTAERGYRLDRFFTQLVLSGSLQGARALVLGDFDGGHEADGKSYVKYALLRFAEDQKIPVYGGLKAGHGAVNESLFFGTKVEIRQQGSQAFLKHVGRLQF